MSRGQKGAAAVGAIVEAAVKPSHTAWLGWSRAWSGQLSQLLPKRGKVGVTTAAKKVATAA